MISLVASAPRMDVAREAAQQLATALRALPDVTVLGPADAILRELRGRHRVQVLVRALDMGPVRPVIRQAIARLPWIPDLRVAIDVDPEIGRAHV